MLYYATYIIINIKNFVNIKTKKKQKHKLNTIIP